KRTEMPGIQRGGSTMRNILLLACVVIVTGAGVSSAAPTTAAAPVVITQRDPLLVGDPRVPRPPIAPCVVTLLDDAVLDDTNSWAQSFSYAPPPGCTGPWAKVVLEAEYRYPPEFGTDDNISGVWLNGANLHFGGTALAQEPEVIPGRFDRDVTDSSALLRRAGTGRVVMDDNLARLHVSVAIVRATARLLFYP